MEIRKRYSKDIAILYVGGKIDIDSAAFIEVTGRLLKEGIQKILCNFTHVDMIDYNGLSILAISYKNVVNQNGVLKFCNVPPHIKGLFKATRLDTVFEIYVDEESALKSFKLSAKVDRLPLRRRFKRVDLAVPVRYKTGLSAGLKFSKGKILNLGGEGLFVYSKDTFPASTELYMEIELAPRKKPFTAMGVVVWLADRELQPHSYPGMGLKFINLDKKAQEQIVNFIDKNITRRSKA